ncbi:CBS domain protein [Clostridium bornimense]|uniref:CBS domain protein n=1 Tax=Clostridium bornimense TaxID=1216932 RepID=W6S348_9CLOT|nr:helix-turn-helix transcriptional regulator [Clostridium bornimense]CDM68732.1 CBS domain protein [Clostridium bornimense]
MTTIKFTSRQEEIMRLVKEFQPITSEKIAKKLNLTRAALRADLSILTMSGMLDAKPKVGYVFSNRENKISIGENTLTTKVKDIMSKAVVVGENTMVYDAVLELFLNDSGTLFIENDGFLVGAASRKDFLKTAIGSSDMHKVPVGIIMTRMPNIVFVEEDDTVISAAKKIIDHEVDCLPVVRKEIKDIKESYKVVGKVSKTNITKLFVEAASK